MPRRARNHWRTGARRPALDRTDAEPASACVARADRRRQPDGGDQHRRKLRDRRYASDRGRTTERTSATASTPSPSAACMAGPHFASSTVVDRDTPLVAPTVEDWDCSYRTGDNLKDRTFAVDETIGLMMSSHGISGAGRAELAAVAGRRRFISPEDAAAELGIDPTRAGPQTRPLGAEGLAAASAARALHPGPGRRRAPRGLVAGPADRRGRRVVALLLQRLDRGEPLGLSPSRCSVRTVVKTAQRVRRSQVRLLDSDYLLDHAHRGLMSWGIQSSGRKRCDCCIADPARTVVDILDAPRLGGGIRHAAEILDALPRRARPAAPRRVRRPARQPHRLQASRLPRRGARAAISPPSSPPAASACPPGSRCSTPTDRRDGGAITRWGSRVNVRSTPRSPS